MSEPASFRELIDVTFQGRERFAAETGIDIKHVDVMKHRDSIAPDHWAAVVAASDRLSLGIEMAMLAELRARRKAERLAARSAQAGGRGSEAGRSVDERAKPLRCMSAHGSAGFATEGQSR